MCGTSQPISLSGAPRADRKLRGRTCQRQIGGSRAISHPGARAGALRLAGRLNVRMASDAVLDLLSPAWQAAIGVVLVVVLVVAGRTLARRGPSRMNRAVVVTGVAVIGVVAIGVLLSSH